MKLAGEIFRKARESQNRTIDDVATALKINKQFLINIENDKIPSLPTTYVRAIIRDFAIELGIEPETILDELRKDPDAASALELDKLPRYTVISVSDRVAPSVHTELRKKKKTHQFQIIVVIAIFIFTGLALSIFFFREKKMPTVVQEISFNAMLRDKESKAARLNLKQDTSLAFQSKSGKMIADTITLEGVAAESVWVRVSSDGIHLSEAVIPAFARKRWVAEKEFLISIGNGAAMSFTLNGQRIGQLSATKRPLKNILLSRETIDKLKNINP
ncbi:MAG: DUF4115 domain-containing protein [Ignavibacteriales bacterium]|nr:DUF4115 domain-containing protein [Ignavibacteriales bacterium]